MSIIRCVRLWKLKRRRKLITRLRDANRRVAEAKRCYDQAHEYHPVCLGGLEDRFAGIEEAAIRYRMWLAERDSVRRKLKLSHEEAKRYV